MGHYSSYIQLWFSNPYFFAIQCRRPWIFKTINLFCYSFLILHFHSYIPSLYFTSFPTFLLCTILPFLLFFFVLYFLSYVPFLYFTSLPTFLFCTILPFQLSFFVFYILFILYFFVLYLFSYFHFSKISHSLFFPFSRIHLPIPLPPPSPSQQSNFEISKVYMIRLPIYRD